eukprot:scaffold37212_cov45-Prasinocladus_malaysianus.AAC.2
MASYSMPCSTALAYFIPWHSGASGVRVWYTVANFEKWNLLHDDLSDPPSYLGKTGPWVMGEYQNVEERMTLRWRGCAFAVAAPASFCQHVL